MQDGETYSAKSWRNRIAIAIILCSPLAATSTGALWIWAVESGLIPAGPFSAGAPYRLAGVLGGLGTVAGIVVLPIRPYFRGLLVLIAFPLGVLATAVVMWLAILFFIAIQSGS